MVGERGEDGGEGRQVRREREWVGGGGVGGGEDIDGWVGRGRVGGEGTGGRKGGVE